MKEKIEKTLRRAAQWLAEVEQATKNRTTGHHKLATTLCVIAGLGALVIMGNVVAASDELFIWWIVTTLKLFLRGLLLVALAIALRLAYRIGVHAWENKPDSKQPFQK